MHTYALRIREIQALLSGDAYDACEWIYDNPPIRNERTTAYYCRYRRKHSGVKKLDFDHLVQQFGYIRISPKQITRWANPPKRKFLSRF